MALGSSHWVPPPSNQGRPEIHAATANPNAAVSDAWNAQNTSREARSEASASQAADSQNPRTATSEGSTAGTPSAIGTTATDEVASADRTSTGRMTPGSLAPGIRRAEHIQASPAAIVACPSRAEGQGSARPHASACRKTNPWTRAASINPEPAQASPIASRGLPSASKSGHREVPAAPASAAAARLA